MQLPFNFYKKIPFYTFIILLFFTATIYAQIPIDSLIAYYKFNRNANDSSGNGYNATFISAALTTDRFGNDSSAFSFNGINNTIQYGDILDDVFCAPIAKFTITGWANTRTSGSYSNGTGFIIGQNAGGSNGPYQWNIAHVDGFLYGAVFSDTMAHNYIALTTPAPENEWYQFALVFDGALPEMQRIKLYLNGNTSNTTVFQHVGTLGETTKATKQHLTIGASHEPNNPQLLNHFYDGSIDDIRIYAKALTQEEIDTLYNEGRWTTINHAPVANAGPDQTVFSDSLSGTLITLDGSASSDLDGDSLAYTWKEADSTIANGVGPTIQLLPGSHTITLTVSDGRGGIDSDQVTINVKYLINGLAAYYPFNGNANDSSGNRYNATYIDASLTTDRFGNDASAYSFNGTSNTIQYGDILDDIFSANVAKFSITGWAKTRTCGNYTTGGGMIMSKSSGGSGIYQWNITHQENQINVAVISDGIAQNYLWLTSPMTTNQWFQFALVFDGSLPEMDRLKLYVNGQSSNTSVYKHQGTLGTTTQNSTQNVCVGASHEYSYPNQLHSFYDGSIDDIRIYAKALTQEKIDSLYHEGGWNTIKYNEPRVVFSTNVGGPVYAGISILKQDVMYAIASGVAIYRMNTSGSTEYTLEVSGEVRSASSIAHDNTVYIASSDRNLYAFTKDGNSAWPPLPTGGILTATPTIDSAANRLYIGVSNHNFVAVNRSTGAVVWNYFADDQIKNSAVITRDRKLIFATQKGMLYGFDLKKYSSSVVPTWQIALPDTAPSSFAVDRQGNIYLGTGSGILMKVALPEKNQPQILWQTSIGGSIVGAPVIDAKGTLYIGSTDSKLYAVDISSGAVKWSFETSGSIRSTPAISDLGNIFVANDNGEVYSLDSNIVVQWYYKTDAAIVSPLLYYNSTLFFGTLGNKVIALYDSSQSSVLKKSTIAAQTEYPIWSTFQGNGQRTGVASDFIITGIEKNNIEIPTSFGLSQNYPNPFNPSTTIRYELPVASNILIKVYNVVGQEVMVLKNGFEQAGYHEVTFENSSLPSGIYFYQMRAGSFFETKKMILMK
jgi:outer membrane protein assembly factor BamB